MAKRASIDTLEAAYDEAVKLVARKARTAKEVADELVKRGAAEADVVSVVARLKAHRHLDDAELASDEAFSLLDSKGLSPAAAVQTLEARGVASAVAREAVEASREGRSDRQLCEAALAKRLKDRPIQAAQIAKEGRALARLGYDEDVVGRALELALKGALSALKGDS